MLLQVLATNQSFKFEKVVVFEGYHTDDGYRVDLGTATTQPSCVSGWSSGNDLAIGLQSRFSGEWLWGVLDSNMASIQGCKIFTGWIHSVHDAVGRHR